MIMFTRDGRRILLLILFSVIFIVFSLSLLRTINDPDFFWHLKTGEWIWQNRSLPSQDPFSFTSVGVKTDRLRLVMTSYWLSEILYYSFYLTTGMSGIILMRFVIVGALIYAMYKRKHSDNIFYIGLLVIVITTLLYMYPIERPQFFSFLCFAIILRLLETIKDGDRAEGRWMLFRISIVMLLWANLHPGVILGQMVLFLYAVTEGVKFLHPSLRPLKKEVYKRLAVAALSGIIFSLLNPNTYHVWQDLLSPRPDINLNVEYFSTVRYFSLYNNYGLILYWLVLLLSIIGFIADFKKADLTDIVLLAGTGFFSFTTVRYIPFFMIAALPVVAGFYSAARLLKIGRVLVVIISFISAAFFASNQRMNFKNLSSRTWIDTYTFPVRASEFIVANSIQGNMYNAYMWGGYLIWRLAPERKVFIDGRVLSADIFELAEVIENANAGEREIAGKPMWKSLLEAYGVKYLIIPYAEPNGEVRRLFFTLITDRDWVPVFFDPGSVIFVQDSPINRDVIKQYIISRDSLLSALIEICDVSIQGNPHNIKPYITKGDLYLIQSRYEEAKAAYKKVIEIAPLNITARDKLKMLDNEIH